MKLSVVIPVGPGREASVIDSLKNQNLKVDIVIEQGKNTSENRNKGIRKSKSEIVSFVNGHSQVPVDWSEKVIKFFKKNPKVDIVGGPQLTPSDSEKFGKHSGYALGSIFGAADVRNRYVPTKRKKVMKGDEKSITSSNLSCRKKVFDKVLFDESIYPGEDPKFISDSISRGFNIAYDPGIVVYNKRRSNSLGLARQIFSYGRTRPKKEGFIETLKKPLFLVPSIFVIYLAFFNLLVLWNFIFILPAIMYLFLNISFSIYESIKNRDISSIFTLPFIFFSIHISYGLGFIYGMVEPNES